MWFPKTPLHWGLVVVPLFAVSWFLFGLTGGIFTTAIVIGSYYAVYYAITHQPKPAEQDDLSQTGSSGALTPVKTAVAVPAPKKPAFAVPSYDVPHVTYQKTPEGFTVAYNKAKINIHRGLHHMKQQKPGTGVAGVGQAVGGLVALGVIGGMRLAQGGTFIEVTREAVTIDGKMMRRQDFGGFHISHTWQVPISKAA
jgi:hypothetical protein